MSGRSVNGTVYELQGPSNAPVIALIHGLGLNRSIWDGLLPALTQNFRVLTYDLLGHGQSVLPPDPPQNSQSLKLFSKQLLGLMDELNIEKAAIVGFSLGGMINRRFAMDHPSRATALGVLNSPHERTPEDQKLVEQRAADVSAGGPSANLDVAIARWFTPNFIAANGDYIQSIKDLLCANHPASYAGTRMVLAAGVTELIRPNPPICHPTLVMTCENDSGSTPAMSEAIGSEIEGAEVVIVPQLQHMGLAERPELFTKPLLDFLAKL